MSENQPSSFTAIITRPERQSSKLKQALQAKGLNVFEFPLIEIKPLTETKALLEALSRLHIYDLVVFVSPNAIDQTFFYLKDQNWPKQTTIGVVGPGSIAALKEKGIALPEYQIIWPEDENEASYSSEGLLAALKIYWKKANWENKRILILRGDVGREWLAEQFKQLGAQVDVVVAYHRCLPEPSVSQWEDLHDILSSNCLDAWLFTSSEGINNLITLANQFLNRDEIALLKESQVLTTHPRIAEVAKQNGFSNVQLCKPGDDNIVEAFDGLRKDSYQFGLDSQVDNSMTNNSKQTSEEMSENVAKEETHEAFSTPFQSDAAPKKTKGNGWLWLIIFILMAIIGAGGYWMHHKIKSFQQNADYQLKPPQTPDLSSAAPVSAQAEVVQKPEAEEALQDKAVQNTPESQDPSLSDATKTSFSEEAKQETLGAQKELVLSDVAQDIVLANQQLQIQGGDTSASLLILRNASQRLQTLKDPKLDVLKKALQEDIERLSHVTLTTTDQLAQKLQTVMEQVNQLPLAGDVPVGAVADTPKLAIPEVNNVVPEANAAARPDTGSFWHRWFNKVSDSVSGQLSQFIRIQVVNKDTALLSPDQASLLKENIHLRLLSARVSLLSHNFGALQQDLTAVEDNIKRYFDPNASQTIQVLQEIETLKQVSEQLKQFNLNSSLQALKTLHIED